MNPKTKSDFTVATILIKGFSLGTSQPYKPQATVLHINTNPHLMKTDIKAFF